MGHQGGQFVRYEAKVQTSHCYGAWEHDINCEYRARCLPMLVRAWQQIKHCTTGQQQDKIPQLYSWPQPDLVAAGVNNGQDKKSLRSANYKAAHVERVRWIRKMKLNSDITLYRDHIDTPPSSVGEYSWLQSIIQPLYHHDHGTNSTWFECTGEEAYRCQ